MKSTKAHAASKSARSPGVSDASRELRIGLAARRRGVAQGSRDLVFEGRREPADRGVGGAIGAGHEHGGGEASLRPEVALVDEADCVELADDARRPRLGQPGAVELAALHLRENGGAGHGDHAHVAAGGRVAQAVRREIGAEGEVLRRADLGHGEALAVEMLGRGDARATRHDERGSARRAAAQDPKPAALAASADACRA